jgi:hypothetical protein
LSDGTRTTIPAIVAPFAANTAATAHRARTAGVVAVPLIPVSLMPDTTPHRPELDTARRVDLARLRRRGDEKG